MSYISTADTAIIRRQPAQTMQRHLARTGPETAWPVGRVLEVVLFLATSACVSLVLCTAAAGALLN